MPLSFIAAFAIALILSMLQMPWMERLGFRLGAVSRPGGRNVNVRAVARFGGPGIFIAFIAPVVLWYFLDSSVSLAVRADPMRVIGLAIGASMMVVLGALDDIRSVRARTKLMVQTAAAVVAFLCHFQIDVVVLPFFGNVSLGWIGLPLTVLWIVGVCNAINLIDGLDGLAAGIVFFAGITNFVVAYMSNYNFVGLLMVSMLGAVVGFLFFNFNPARIFMGDSGSYFLGFVLAVTAVAAPFQKASAAVSLLVPIVALGVPIIDTLFAMFRRILERRPLFSPDRGHIHHRLLDVGVTHRRAVLIIYAASILLTVAAIAISIGKDWQVGLAILGAAIVMFGLVRTAGLFGRAEVPLIGKNDAAHVAKIRKAVPACLLALQASGDVWATLRAFASDAGITLEVLRPGMPTPPAGSAQAYFTLGPEATATTDLRFVFAEIGELGLQQATALLQLVIDVAAEQLRA